MDTEPIWFHVPGEPVPIYTSLFCKSPSPQLPDELRDMSVSAGVLRWERGSGGRPSAALALSRGLSEGRV
jgi:hypothetical protein